MAIPSSRMSAPIPVFFGLTAVGMTKVRREARGVNALR